MSFGPGDVKIHDATLSGADVSSRLKTVSVYEDIKKPYVLVEAEIIDVGDILNTNIGLTGRNEFSISFSQPGQDPWVGTNMLVTNVEKGRTAQNQRYATYNIQAVSNHMEKAPNVQKVYINQIGTNIIQNLVGEFLGPVKSLRIGDPSRGILGNKMMPFHLAGVPIWNAIRTVMLRSAATIGKSSTYTLFENNKNMVLDTMENMLNKAVAGPVATYISRPMGQDWLRDQTLQNFIILSLQEDTRIDATQTIQDRNIATQPFDLLSHTATEIIKGNKNAVSSLLQPVYNMLRPPLYAAEVAAARKQFAGKLDAAQFTMEVALNPALTVGAGVRVDTFAPPGDSELKLPDKLNGSHLIINTRHTMNLYNGKSGMAGTTTVRCVRPISGMAGYA